jgi:hypothetical protein
MIILSISFVSVILLLSNQCTTKDIFTIVYSATDNNTHSTYVVLDNSSGNNFSTTNMKLNIGFVKPTFTVAAYNHAFYDFYLKYGPIIHKGENLTTDLNLLTSKIPDYEHTFIKGLYSFINSSLVRGSTITLVDHVKQLLPRSNISIISDPAIDNGSIFNGDGTNKYDILLFGHEEYVTQQEYDNLKRFVANGGTMILIDGNIFYAQVRYDRNNQTVTLVKGHGWAFNGKSAWISILERYENETRQWVGSNYYHGAASMFYGDGSLRFSNNPFNYSALEENYISNPKDKIILDYGSSDPRYKIATYELEFGKGKVIGFGIAGERPLQLKNSNFFKFFDEVLLKYAIPKFAASGSNSTTQYNATKIADT